MRDVGMRAALRAGLAFICLLLASFAAAADDSRVEAEVAAVDAAMASAYEQALGRFDQAMQQAPRDASLAIARCEFMQRHSDPEGGHYLERAEADLEACERSLDAWAEAPAVLIHRFEQQWGDDAQKAGDALLARSDSWPPALRRRLAAGLAERYRYSDKTRARGNELVILAAELGNGQHVGAAAKALAEAGEEKRAQSLLQNAAPADSDWIASERVRAALALPGSVIALRELQRHMAAGRTIAPAVAALVHLRAGKAQAAKAALTAVTEFEDEELRDARFQVAVALGDYAGAAAAVRMTDMAYLAQNTGRFLTLVHASPASLFQPVLWLSLAVLLAFVLGYLLVPGLVLVPVHYRGLARRCAGRQPPPLFEPVGLRHAWLAAVAFLLVPLGVLAAIDPEGFGPVFADGASPDPKRLLQLVTLSSAVSLLLFTPMLVKLASLGHFDPRTLARTWKRILVAIGATLAVGAALAAMHRAMGADTATQQVEMVHQLINHGRSPWAGVGALLVIALLVPIWEEFAFRGLVMGGIARHIGFGWANFLQALFFALCHMDWPRFPYYLVMGLMAGWLVKSSGRLAPAIAMHMAINALAFFVQRG